MRDHRLTFDTDLKGLDAADWLSSVEDLVEEHGSFTPLGPDYTAAFLDAGPKLLITFEHVDEVLREADATPRGFDFSKTEGWSVLTILSTTESWFRDDRVYAYFDRLIDDGFFEDFEDVLFFGAQAGGYAAAAFSVAAPGARVLALRPHATLDPTIAGWETRYVRQRRYDFTDRYGYAPDMIDAVDRAYIVYSPQQRLDAMHAALFTKPNTTMLRVHGLGGRMDVTLDSLGILDDLITDAMNGTLTTARFGRAMKMRKTSPQYLKKLVKRLMDGGHDTLAAAVCQIALLDGPNPYYERQLREIEAARGNLLADDSMVD